MTRHHLIVLATLAALAGCQAPYPSEHGRVYGDTVRAVLASEVIPPQRHSDLGADGAAASAAYTNYQKSYVSPTPQSASPTFGSK
jgi:hypothetical protein